MPGEYDHCYAAEVLRKSSVRLFVGSKEILNMKYSGEKIDGIKSSIFIGKEFIEEQDGSEYRSIGYERLKRMGLKIVSQRIDKIWSKQTIKVVYRIVRESAQKSGIEYFRIPPGHHLYLNERDGIVKLVGRNTTPTGSFLYKYKREKKKKKYNWLEHEDILIGDYEDAQGIFYEDDTDSTEGYRSLDIELIILGIDIETGKLVCIEKKLDMPVVIITGQRGQGKTLLEHRLADNIYHKWHISVVFANDVKPETQYYCRGVNKKKDPFNNIGELSKVGEKPVPLPMVYIHPTSDKLNTIFYKGQIGFPTSISFKDLINNVNTIEIVRAWKFGDSQKIFESIVNAPESRDHRIRLENIMSYAEIEECLHSYLDPKKDTGSLNKLKQILYGIWKSKIVDKSSKTPAKWVMEMDAGKEAYPPWIACIIADIVPSVITSHLKKEAVHPIIFQIIMEDIFKHMKTNPLLADKEVMTFISEAEALLRVKKIRENLMELISEGRGDRIGSTISLQTYKNFPIEVLTNVAYTFSFRQNVESEAKRIVKNNAIEKSRVEDLLNLNTYECLATGDFVLIDSQGNRSKNNGREIKMRILPPNSMHRTARAM